MASAAELEPYAAADKLLERYGQANLPVNVERIAKFLGIIVRYSPLEEQLSGMIAIKDGTPIIGVNSNHHPNRQRFTIAHEIGHFELHKHILSNQVHVDKGFPVLMRDQQAATGEEQREIDANRFAAALLMPTATIQALLRKKVDINDDKPLEELAKKLRVSRQALEYRIRNLA